MLLTQQLAEALGFPSLDKLLKESSDLMQHSKCNTKQDWCRANLAELLKESSDLVQHSKCNTKQDWCRANLAELLKESSDLVQHSSRGRLGKKQWKVVDHFRDCVLAWASAVAARDQVSHAC